MYTSFAVSLQLATSSLRRKHSAYNKQFTPCNKKQYRYSRFWARIRVRFFKKIQDWILKSKRI